MKRILNNTQQLLSKHFNFFILAVVLIWIKTYIAYRAEFSLGIENTIQEFLLLLNPLSSAIFFLGFALFAKKKFYPVLIILNFLMSFLLYANILYYRFFSDYITLPTLTQTKNAGDLGQSIGGLLHSYDLLYFLDTLIIIALVVLKVAKPKASNITRPKLALVYLTSFIIFGVNLGLAEADRPQLLTRTFDRNYIVKYLGMYNYQIYDAVLTTKSNTQRALADSSDMTNALNYTKATYAEPNPELFGIAKGRNVIYVHMESLQNFVINYDLNGQEVTPFLNSLTRDKETFYFDNFFHQTSQGKTADAEFLIDNSIFGLPQGTAYSTKARNTYHAAPAILGQKGYTSAVFHGNYKSFWNRDEMYKSQGFDYFFDAEYYSMLDEDVVNYGLKDKPFFKESVPMLETLKQPFYTKFITLTNHFPFPIDEEEATIEPATTGNDVVDHYFQTARYSDEALKEFFDYLKQSGLYENSVIILYGDHYGISENHNKAMSQILDKEITDYETAGLQRVPLFIHIPGVEGGVMHQYGGQVDLFPTLLHLLGMDSRNYLNLGTDLFSQGHKQHVVFRNGDFVTPTVSSIKGNYYDSSTGEQIEKNEEIIKYEEMAETKLGFSDKIVYGDLLRFYTPEGFVPIDPSDYTYINVEEVKEQMHAGEKLQKQ
jgi:lipoteichoic acid synthase